MRPALQSNRFSHLPRVFGRALVVVLPAVLLVTFLAVHFRHHGYSYRGELPVFDVSVSSESGMDGSAAALTPRPIFPYSVVPGGVRDSQELQKAASADPVVARHYSDFQIAKSRTIQLTQPMAMYVSYRRNNQVYWTRNRMMIPAGETLISDGENLARVRCGNRLSPVAAKPVAATEPDQEELETPEFIPPMLANLLPGESREFFPGGTAGGTPVPGPGPNSNPGPPSTPVLPPFLGPGVPPITPGTIPVPPPVNTPEPNSLSLLFAGAALIFLFAAISLRRNGAA